MSIVLSTRITPASLSQVDSRLLINGQISFTIQSFAFNVENPVNLGSAGGGAGAGKVRLSSIGLTKITGPESSFLFQALCSGLHLKDVTLEMILNSGKAAKAGAPFYTIELRNVLVSHFQHSGSSGDHPGLNPHENWMLAYGAIQTAYHPTDKTGKLDKPFISSWDQTTNTSKFEP